ncbi:hypothetical protein [Aquimarina sp. Aq107]|uniref:hypothetical protein n=1 Tax=Aquimarina sp. Aq107 TaxID=1191912 RepID=UPI000D56177D|nr:hypothetical protein [Aquimarina sp. Aq107]
MERKLKLIWDFRGPVANKTAQHHVIHLNEYITSEGLSIKNTGHQDVNEFHCIAYMVVTDSEMKKVRDALKPHRGQLFQE